MDCSTARLVLTLGRPGSGELLASETQALTHHLDSCPECRALARTLRADDDHLRAAMVAVPVPDGLRERLHARLAEAQATTVRIQRRRRVGLVAAAAAVLLVLTGGTFWWVRQRPGLDLDYVLADVQDRLTNAEEVDTWFAQKYRIRTVAPREFNYGWLTSCSLGVVQGRRAPELVFVRGSLPCRVWILTDQQFDLQSALQAARVSSGGYTVELRPHPALAGVAYLIVYSAESLDPFLLDQGRPTA